MKKLFSIIFTFALSLGIFAQNDTLFIHKGQFIYEFPTAEVDSIVFYRTQPTTPLPRDTIFITLPPDTIVLTDTVFITLPPDTIVRVDTIIVVRVDTVCITPTIDPGVVINGVRWATRNVDMPGTFAEYPESAGMFYQWGRNIGWNTTNPMINSNGGTEWDSSFYTGDAWARANDPCPAGWRVPTRAEIQSLVDTDNVSSEWTTVNGVNGRTFTDRTTNNTFFLPAVGWRANPGGALSSVGTDGFYWSSTFNPASSSFPLWFNSVNVNAGTHTFNRANGMSVRCVAE